MESDLPSLHMVMKEPLRVDDVGAQLAAVRAQLDALSQRADVQTARLQLQASRLEAQRLGIERSRTKVTVLQERAKAIQAMMQGDPFPALPGLGD